ncbi:hypothetical protein PRIPAC_81570 [Pristionchus pacificus]|nr:hypothetical protein PRIPAC_81570 [Pristionchus pacificus]
MENRSCLICTVPITVTIFGVEACRACTSFFKRTVIAGRTFTCRQGDRQCEIRKHEKYMCRCCRYDRCVNLGMYYALPPKKKPRKQRALTTTGEVAKAPPIVELPSLSTSSPSSTTPVNDSDAVDSEGCEISLLPEVSLIDRMEDEYKASYERRLILEKEYVASRNLPRFDHPTEEFYIANFTALYELFRIAINDSTGLLQNVIDDFEEFPIDHRVALFKNFVTKFSMIEWVYYSTRIFPDSTSMFMASLITCADARKMDEWMEDGVKCVKNEAFRTTVQGYSCNYMDMFGAMAKMGELTEREFYALAILTYCDIGQPHETTCLFSYSHFRHFAPSPR